MCSPPLANIRYNLILAPFLFLSRYLYPLGFQNPQPFRFFLQQPHLLVRSVFRINPAQIACLVSFRCILCAISHYFVDKNVIYSLFLLAFFVLFIIMILKHNSKGTPVFRKRDAYVSKSNGRTDKMERKSPAKAVDY